MQLQNTKISDTEIEIIPSSYYNYKIRGFIGKKLALLAPSISIPYDETEVHDNFSFDGQQVAKKIIINPNLEFRKMTEIVRSLEKEKIEVVIIVNGESFIPKRITKFIDKLCELSIHRLIVFNSDARSFKNL